MHANIRIRTTRALHRLICVLLWLFPWSFLAIHSTLPSSTFLPPCPPASSSYPLAQTQGLYRVSGTKTRYVKLHADVLQKHKQPLLAEEDVTVVTSCLKYFLRQMSEPLLTRGLYTAFIDAVRGTNQGRHAHAQQ